MLPGSLACFYEVGTAALADMAADTVSWSIATSAWPASYPGSSSHGTKAFWYLDAPSFAGLNANETCALRLPLLPWVKAGRSVKLGWVAVPNPFAEVKRS
jgi:hypothetical protein